LYEEIINIAETSYDYLKYIGSGRHVESLIRLSLITLLSVILKYEKE